jgi:PST family polysaccharide transporter
MTADSSRRNDERVVEDGSGAGYTDAAVSGIAWQGLIGLAIRVLRALVFLALARLLVPEAFGLVALATVFTTILMHLTGGGFSQALIRQPCLTRAHLDTAFHTNIAVGLVLGSALALGSGTISGWLGEPRLQPVLLGLSVMPVLAGVSSVPEGLLSREMQFRSLSIRHLFATGTSTTVALVLAFAGAGVWALVAQTVLEAVVSCTALWLTARKSYRPGLRVTRQALGDLTGYGIKVVGHDLTSMVSSRADDLIIGATLGARSLGVYSVAYRLLTLLQETLQGVVSGVAFPLYSRLQDEPERLARGFLRASRLSLAIAGPIFVFVAGATPQIVPLTLGEQWLAAAPVMTALALSGVPALITDANGTLLAAKGLAGRVLALTLLGAGANLAGFIVAVRYGIVWVAVAFTIRAYLLLPLSMGMTAPHLGGWRPALRAYAPIVGLLTIPALAGTSVPFMAPAVTDAGALLIAGLVGAACYLFFVRLLARDCYFDLRLVAERFLRLGNRRRSSP